jgi:hypothetical protein
MVSIESKEFLMNEKIEKLSQEISEELGLNPRDTLYIKNVLLRFSMDILKDMIFEERKRVEEIHSRGV